MTTSTWNDYVEGLSAEDVALISALRALTKGLSETVENVTATEVQFKRARTYTSAYVKSHYLEVAIDLLREVEHPLLRASFPTTKKVFTHRLTFTRVDQLDDDVAALVREAYETVGPGTR
jgi:Zn-dependent M32 family carboxypeptidase